MLSAFCGKLSVGRSLGKLTPRQLGDEDEIDEDVKAEADRVADGGANSDVVKVRSFVFFFVPDDLLSLTMPKFLKFAVTHKFEPPGTGGGRANLGEETRVGQRICYSNSRPPGRRTLVFFKTGNRRLVRMHACMHVSIPIKLFFFSLNVTQ